MPGKKTAKIKNDNPNLGFGNSYSEVASKRMINRDGSFNVKRDGLNYFTSLSLYHSLLDISWPRFFLFSALYYFILNAIFAVLYLIVGADSIGGSPTDSFYQHLLDAFFFSVQTSSTIGYGHLIPGNNLANIIVTLESFIGLLSVAVITGLLFARFSKPTAKILFSKNALISPFNDISGFMFRIVNVRKNQLLEMEAEVNVVINEIVNGKKARKFHKLELEYSRIPFFPLSWTIVHPIDENSPLKDITKDTLSEADPEFLILLKGIDDTFNQYVYSRSSYKASEVIWGAKFNSIVQRNDSKKHLSIDIAGLNSFDKVKLN